MEYIPDIETTTNDNEPYLACVNWLLQQKTIPKVILTSYSDLEQTIRRLYDERVCKQFAQDRARGTTLFFASGDYGLGNPNACLSNDGKKTPRFLPEVPASCLYGMVVGATVNMEPEESAYNPEPKHNPFSSVSGFSIYFERLFYQNDAVPAYIESIGDQFAGLYNQSGRAYPDIAAHGTLFIFFWNGTEIVINGKSASTPLVASIFALVNDALIAGGKPTLGWLNPWLYKKGYQGLTDITKGFSHGCNIKRFYVQSGWDPVTGFGTPDFTKLLKLVSV